MHLRHWVGIFPVLAACAFPAVLRADAPVLAGERVVLHTHFGRIVLGLYSEEAPRHSAQILKMARAGLYDGAKFFRIEPGFVIQLEDLRHRQPPLRPEQLRLITPLPEEIGRLKHRRGVLSMARWTDRPGSAETSFSILLGDAPHLDGSYTVFGRVLAGMEVVDKIAGLERDEHNRPTQPVIVSQARVSSAPVSLPQTVPLTHRSVGREEEVSPPPAIGDGLPGIRSFVVSLAIIALISLIAILAGTRLAPRYQTGLHALNLLVAAFVLAIVWIPRVTSHPLYAPAVFFAILGLFKLMSRFESGAPGPKPPPPADAPRDSGNAL